MLPYTADDMLAAMRASYGLNTPDLPVERRTWVRRFLSGRRRPSN
jgi:hypothetical protein